MCKALDDMCADAMEEGRKEGIKKGRKEGIKEGRKEGLKKGIKEGLSEGLKKGRSEGESRMSRLISVLLSQNNLEAVKLATSDSDARNRLYKQYNII